MGDIAVLGLRLRFMRSLDDPQGFKQSLKTIYHQTRQQSDNSMVLTTKTSSTSQTNSARPASEEAQPDENASQWSWSQQERPSGSLSQSQPEVNEITTGTQSLVNDQSVRSRWDEVRATNQKEAPRVSAWQRVRENPGQETSQSKVTSTTSQDWDQRQRRSAEEDRALAQAEFDRMVDGERNVNLNRR